MRDRVVNLLLGAERYYGSTLAYAAIRYVPLPESLYPAVVYIHADRWRQSRAFWRRFRVIYRVEVVMQEPIPLARWRGDTLLVASPDVSDATNVQYAVTAALVSVRERVLADRRGAADDEFAATMIRA